MFLALLVRNEASVHVFEVLEGFSPWCSQGYWLQWEHTIEG